MKFSLAILAAAFGSASAVLPIYGTPKRGHKIDSTNGSIQADSPMGMKILSQARRLEQDDEEDFLWVADYSLKFQGCHHISQWNEEADGEEEVKIQTKRLVRFRLCPTAYCSIEDAGGCDSGYGDYIVDLNVFLEAYMQAVLNKQEWDCEYHMNYVCGCNDDDKDDNFNEEYCMYDCYMDAGMDYCVEDNPYVDDDNDEEEFNLEEYVECAGWDIPDNNRRRLEQDEVEYFIGPYCAEQGGAVFLGLFTDETCTTFADEYGGKELYYTYTNDYLPYCEKSVIGMECFDCKEPVDPEEQQNQDQQDEDEVIEMCEEMYQAAGKCETYLADGVVKYPNENACNYMEGIKIVRQDGIVVQQESSSNKTAAIFIGLFAVSFVLLGAYVYYLKTKLDRAKINLSE